MANTYGIMGFHFSTNVAPANWVSTGLTIDVHTNLTSFDFLDNAGNNNSLNINSADRIVHDGTSYQVAQIHVIGLTINLREGGNFAVPAVSGQNATGFRVYELGGGNYILRPIDNTLSMPNLPNYMAWDTFTFTSRGTTDGTTMSVQDDWFPTCFVAGTLIQTATGPRAVEVLTPGDMIETRDHGMQTLRWIGRESLSVERGAAHPDDRPIVIEAHALGDGLPARRLRVSPQHRILLSGPVVARMFGCDEILAPAKALLERTGVYREAAGQHVDYFHLLFDRHEVILAEALPSESFFPGPQAMKSLNLPGRVALLDLLPQAGSNDCGYAPARPFATVRRVGTLVRRSAGRPLVEVVPAARGLPLAV